MSAITSEAQHIPAPAPLTPARRGRAAIGRLLRRRRGRLAVHVQRGTIGLTALAVILGVYLAAQWQSKPRPTSAAPEYRREVATATIQRLEAEQSDLKRQIADMRAQIAEQQKAQAAGRTELAGLTSELQHEKLLAGTVAVRGPGLNVMLDDSAVKQIPAKEDPSMYIVHEYQLRDVVNVLWAAGAEAIAINGERMVGPTSIYCVGSTILVNDTRTSPPYEFAVVGDAARLETALTEANNLRALKSRIKLYGLQFTVQKQRELTVPAFSGSLDVRHALIGNDRVAQVRVAPG